MSALLAEMWLVPSQFTAFLFTPALLVADPHLEKSS